MELSPSLLSRPPVPNYIEFTRRQKGQKVEFTQGQAAWAERIELGENGSIIPRPKGKPR